jgi:hypothetical protein
MRQKDYLILRKIIYCSLKVQCSRGTYVEDAVTTLSSGTLFGTPYTEVLQHVSKLFISILRKNTTLSSGTLSGTPHKRSRVFRLYRTWLPHLFFCV